MGLGARSFSLKLGGSEEKKGYLTSSLAEIMIGSAHS